MIADVPVVLAYRPSCSRTSGRGWVDWSWVADHRDQIRDRLREHIELTVLAVGLGLLDLAPARRSLSRTLAPRVHPALAITGVLYTIPSLALFTLLLPWTGLSRTHRAHRRSSATRCSSSCGTRSPASTACPPDVREAATGMGYTPRRLAARVELPLAMPAIIAGIRIADGHARSDSSP